MEGRRVSTQLPQVWLGAYGAQAAQQPDDTDVDDEQLAVTPSDVIEALGFDPLELDDEGDSLTPTDGETVDSVAAAKSQTAQASRQEGEKSPPR
jgi:hypothetical protein